MTKTDEQWSNSCLQDPPGSILWLILRSHISKCIFKFPRNQSSGRLWHKRANGWHNTDGRETVWRQSIPFRRQKRRSSEEGWTGEWNSKTGEGLRWLNSVGKYQAWCEPGEYFDVDRDYLQWVVLMKGWHELMCVQETKLYKTYPRPGMWNAKQVSGEPSFSSRMWFFPIFFFTISSVRKLLERIFLP